MSRESVPDVLANVEARGLLLDLDARGIHLLVRRGNLATTTPERLTEADRAALRRHKADLLVLVLMTDDRCLDRLLALRAGRGLTAVNRALGCCHTCGDALPPSRPTGRCGWCALAARLFASGPIPPDVIELFGEDIRGTQTASQAGSALPFDTAVPA